MSVIISSANTHRRGSALVYILIAIALLGALTATLMDSSSQQISTQKGVNFVAEMKSQIGLIRAGIKECVLTYPEGDAAIAANPATMPALRPYNYPYPLKPNDVYLASPTSGVSWVDDIGCPGNPGNSNSHRKIFGGTSGKYFPKPAKPFDQWYYYNGANGIYVMNWTAATDSFITTSLQRLEQDYAKCEADIIDARSGTVTVDTEGSTCVNGRICFRYWLLVKPGASYPNEAGCPGT